MKRTPLKRTGPPKRRTPLRSSAPLSRETLLRPVNPERRKRERQRAYGPPERRTWMKRQPSVASGQTPCVNAHVPDPSGPSGTGRKADARWIVPLTWEEHEELHAIGVRSFEAKYEIDLQDEARRTNERWGECQREGES